eukprot:g3225.t1
MYKHIVICGGSCRDQLLGGLPNVYLYAANNPSESILAKRRGYGCLVSYNVPPYARAGLYKELQSVRGLLSELLERREDVEGEGQRLRAAAPAVPAAAPAASAAGDGEPVEPTLEAAAVVAAGLQKDLPFPSDVQQAISAAGDDVDAAAAAGAAAFEVEGFEDYAGRLRSYLAELEATLFSEGSHRSLALVEQRLFVLAQCGSESGELREQLRAARETVSLLERNVEEISGMLRALNGEYVLPAPGGDLIRDGAAVLPTGRNIHALDPYRIPSQTALQRGLAAAEKTIEGYRAEHGEYPEPWTSDIPPPPLVILWSSKKETIAVNLWGLEAIKTRGESVAVALGLIGARPVCEATGRVARYELIPLQELGRPRVDALCSLSGIFRDSFANIVELLDDALARAAQSADEPVEQNFVRKHYLEIPWARDGEVVGKYQGPLIGVEWSGMGGNKELLEEEEDEEAALSRIFSNAAGEFGSLVNERVVAGTWERDEDGCDGTIPGELGETWASRNAFAFGRQQKGVPRAKVLDKLMSTSGSLVQLTDSVEYGLTDIQEYYANSGAMTFLEEVALEGTPPLATFSAGDPALDHTICYELIVQRWRPWSFDASNVRRFRARALRKCQLEDRGLQKKIVLVKRESFTRQNMIFLPPAAAVVEIGVECELEGASAWLQGAPTSQFAKLARQANLFYTAVMDCAGAACNRAQEKGQWDRGWCNSDVKKRPFVEVDVAKKLIPVLWVVYDEPRHLEGCFRAGPQGGCLGGGHDPEDGRTTEVRLGAADGVPDEAAQSQVGRGHGGAGLRWRL